MKLIISRIVIDIILLAAVFVLPWWLSILLFALSVFIFNFQYEIIIIGYIADASYGAGTGFNFLFLGMATALVIASIILKPRLKFYSR